MHIASWRLTMTSFCAADPTALAALQHTSLVLVSVRGRDAWLPERNSAGAVQHGHCTGPAAQVRLSHLSLYLYL